MAINILDKVTYTDLLTVIGADNLNDIQDAIMELQNQANARTLFFTGVTVSATTGTILTKSDSRITANHVLSGIVINNMSAITSDLNWTTSAGKIVITGTCTTATTADITLTLKDN